MLRINTHIAIQEDKFHLKRKKKKFRNTFPITELVCTPAKNGNK